MSPDKNLRQNFLKVNEKIAAACARGGRAASAVRLVAVTKTFPAEVIREAYGCGQRIFAENYAQEAKEKRNELSDLSDLEWHFIGALQTNKVKLLANEFALIHSVDRLKLAEEISKRSNATTEALTTQKILLEVNLAGEDSKSGCAVAELPALLEKCQSLPNLKIMGLMFMPPLDLNSGDQKKYFARARETRDNMKKYLTENHSLDELSMGTSHDFEAAIEEGATLVRLGSVLFGQRK